jgi:hypothetical protein
MRRPAGFSLIECLIGLALSFFVVLASLEFFSAARKSYSRLKDREEAAQGAAAALDKMSVDILRAGQGLARAAALGLVEPVAESGGALLLSRAEEELALAADVRAGDSRLPLAQAGGAKPGREICLEDGVKGEVFTVASVAAGTAVLASPLGHDYSRDATSVLLLERVALSLDARQGILRRKVNLSTAQPLLENVRAAEFLEDRAANLVRVRFSLGPQGDATYELCLFPKNPALAGRI